MKRNGCDVVLLLILALFVPGCCDNDGGNEVKPCLDTDGDGKIDLAVATELNLDPLRILFKQ